MAILCLELPIPMTLPVYAKNTVSLKNLRGFGKINTA